MNALQELYAKLQKINYSNLITILKPIIITFISSMFTNKATTKHYLNKEHKPKDVSTVIMPPELIEKYNNIDIDKVASNEFKDSILQFADVVTKSFPQKNLINFNNNINDLMVRIDKKILDGGLYNVELNELILNIDQNDNTTILHELFHMASSVYKDGIIYSGFMQIKSKPDFFKIGMGITEGYTELLTHRYFKVDSKSPYAYQSIVTEIIEGIIGKEKMESLYLNANLKGLIDEIKQYISENEIMEFISDLDFVTKNIYDKNVDASKKNILENSLKNIAKFLIICYSRKMQQESKDSYADKIEEFISNITFNVIISGNTYKTISDEIVTAALQAVNAKGIKAR